jgi:hypothetical protein
MPKVPKSKDKNTAHRLTGPGSSTSLVPHGREPVRSASPLSTPERLKSQGKNRKGKKKKDLARQDQSTTIAGGPPHDPPSTPAVTPYLPAIASPRDTVSPIMDKHPAPELGPPQNPPAMPMSILGGAKDFTVNSSLITNVQGNFNPTIFKFDGGQFGC